MLQEIREVAFGDHFLSTLPLSLLTSFRMSIHPAALGSLVQSTSLSEFDALMDSAVSALYTERPDKRVFSQPSLIGDNWQRIRNAWLINPPEIQVLFQRCVVETGEHCNLDFEPARTRREVAALSVSF